MRLDEAKYEAAADVESAANGDEHARTPLVATWHGAAKQPGCSASNLAATCEPGVMSLCEKWRLAWR